MLRKTGESTFKIVSFELVLGIIQAYETQGHQRSLDISHLFTFYKLS